MKKLRIILLVFAICALAALGIYGGRQYTRKAQAERLTEMEAALEGLTRPDGTRPLLIAVTQLTSTDQQAMEEDLWIEKPLPVCSLAGYFGVND